MIFKEKIYLHKRKYYDKRKQNSNNFKVYNYVLKINVRKSAINVTKRKYTPKLIFKYTFIGILMNEIRV